MSVDIELGEGERSNRKFLTRARAYARRIYQKVFSFILSNYRKGTFVVDEQWDYLIILDACRYDAFKYVNHIEGKLEYRFSQGSTTTEFLLKNFANKNKNKKYNDIVYITANPYVDKLLGNTFYKIYSVWNYGWSDDYNTVLPKILVNETLKIIKIHKDKKLIIHFMQPHMPFLIKNFETTGYKAQRKAVLENKNIRNEIAWWDLLLERKIEQKEVIKAYLLNLKIVLLWVDLLINSLKGKIIITSDHGNTFGEITHPLFPFKIYAHPAGLHVEKLVKVPWFIVIK